MAKNPAKSSRRAQKKDNFVSSSRSRSVLSDYSLRGKIPEDILRSYEVHEWKHAAAILVQDFPAELRDIVDVLRHFRVKHDHIAVGGGGKTKLASSLDQEFKSRGWNKKRWSTAILLDQSRRDSPTHEVDCVKNKIALELEWSNKDPFYDRDLNNFRLLFELRAISVGIIITKSDELAGLFDDIGIWSKYGTTTTWMSKLLPRIEGGGGGGCPILVFGIRRQLYDPPKKRK